MRLNLAKSRSGKGDIVGLLIFILIIYFLGKALGWW